MLIKTRRQKLVAREEIAIHPPFGLDPSRQREAMYLDLAIPRGLVSERGKWLLIQFTGMQNVMMMFPGEDPGLFFTTKEAAKNYYELFFRNNSYLSAWSYFICRREEILNAEKMPAIERVGRLIGIQFR